MPPDLTHSAPPEEAEAFVQSILDRATDAAPELQTLSSYLSASCGIHLRDMIDHLGLPDDGCATALGWRQEQGVWRAPHPTLPDIVESPRIGIVLRVESIERFQAALGLRGAVSTPEHAPLRLSRIVDRSAATISAIERRGAVGYAPILLGERTIRRARIHQQIFRTRRRQFQNVDRAVSYTLRLSQAAAADLGAAWAGALFADAEREYWRTRSGLAARQHYAQSRAGIGWCTVDTLGYACSRAHFGVLSEILECFGYARSALAPISAERCGLQFFEAPARAGLPRIAVSLDLAAHEISKPSIAHQLSPLTWHGPAGLWCALHGESILDGGLHGLTARYRVQTAAPLEREHHAVSPLRADALERDGYLTRAQAERFRLSGATGAFFMAADQFDFGAVFGPDLVIQPSEKDRAPTRRRRLRTRRTAPRIGA